ncbi:tetratricopeptide repeat protein [Streptomyces sp. LP05-1]|uniref:Tetratricopeptide repeat protein n=1 Tax=Streptomyces pyxinae TaxID=2970734 RepID=A0ABT2CNW5_9ACTN|nr:tetratricopeptide repeat protein [Streptomyces sp. LP05-1]MCS0639133.1 tetratricopeptide repeat protein [Streptomyces sp. LP05-1]
MVAGGTGAVLTGAAMLLLPLLGPGAGGPDRSGGPPPAAGPAGRAMTAAATGARAALTDLTALIDDRESWLRAHPRDAAAPAAWAVLGSAYVQRGLLSGDPAAYPRAQRALDRSLAARPAGRGNTAAQLGLGALAGARGDFATAKRWGETVRKREPANAAVYPVLIEAYLGLGELPAAGTAAERLRELRPGAPALGLTARVHWARGWREDALARAREAVASAGTPAEKAGGLQALGEMAWERGEPAEAVGWYDAALAAVPGHPPSLAGRARALVALGRTAGALRDYSAALAAQPLARYALELGELYASLDRGAEADAWYATVRERAAAAARNGADETLTLARYEADHGDPDTAVTALRAAWDGGRRTAETADALGWALYRAGAAKEALPFARRAVDQGQRSARFPYHLGMIERELDQAGPARRHLAEALRIHPDFSPLWAPEAREVLEALGEPSEGGPPTAAPTAPAAGKPPTGKPPADPPAKPATGN